MTKKNFKVPKNSKYGTIPRALIILNYVNERREGKLLKYPRRMLPDLKYKRNPREGNFSNG